MNVFLALVAASLLSRLSYQMARSPVLPRFAEDLGAGPELIGMIVAASTVTGIFLKLPAGALSDVLGKKRMMVLGSLFFAGPPFLYPFVHSAEALLALRFVHGFATGIFSPVASAYVASLGTKNRGARLGWYGSVNDIGSTAGPLVGGLVLFYTASFEATYLLVGALGVLALILVLRLPESRAGPSPEDSQESQSRQFVKGLAEVLSTTPLIVASCVEGAMYFGFGAFLGFLPTYGKTVGLNDAEVAVILGIQLATAMAMKPIAGRTSDLIGRKAVIVAGLLFCALSLPFIFRASDLTTLMVLSAFLGFGVAAVTPVTHALVADVAKERHLGAAMGVFGTIFDVGEAAGPIAAGFLIGQMSYASAFDLLAAVVVAGAIAFIVLVRDPTAPRGAQAST